MVKIYLISILKLGNNTKLVNHSINSYKFGSKTPCGVCFVLVLKLIE